MIPVIGPEDWRHIVMIEALFSYSAGLVWTYAMNSSE